MLTQKGREPFIRMKVFLDDEEAIEALKNKKPTSSPAPTTASGGNSIGVNSQKSQSNSTSFSSMLANCAAATSRAASIQMGCLFSNSNSMMVEEDRLSNSNSRSSSVSLNTTTALDSGELDTESIVEQVKEILHSNGIGQKLFGEAVLGVSQGTVSELLSKPKIWPLLSLRGREPYIRMYWWLQDPLRVQKLQEYCLSQTNSKQNSGYSGVSVKRPYDVMNDEWSQASGVHLAGVGNFSLKNSIFGAPANKKPRSMITEQQKEALRFAFEHEPYPSAKTVEFLSEELQLRDYPQIT